MNGIMLREKLTEATHNILKPGDFHDDLAPAIKEYHDLLTQASEIDPDDAAQRMHIQTDHGNAIGVYWAACCVKEIFRTQRFVKGLAQAIDDLHQKGKKTVHILYAGTGPFAALALPIMLHYKPSQVKFTLIEINENSYQKLLALLKDLDLMTYVSRLELADATKYQIKDTEIDIVLSETMNLALCKEPQVKIMLNLGSQVNEETVFIPQDIKITLCKETQNTSLEKIQTLIQFDSRFIKENARLKSVADAFKTHELTLDLTAMQRLCYLTEIIIYKDFKLKLNDSSLTLLKPIKLEQKTGKMKLAFQYQMSGNPGFIATTIG